MPSRRFDWHEHLKEVWGEYRSVRAAVDQLKVTVATRPDLFDKGSETRAYLRVADAHLEGTYIVRLFAAFEAALRSYDRARHDDPNRQTDASSMIDQISGKRGMNIEDRIRQGAHRVRRVRNFWAHESDREAGPVSVDEARAWLNTYLSKLPEEW